MTGGPEPGAFRLIDTHVHRWDPSQGYPWLRGPLRRRHGLPELFAAVDADPGWTAAEVGVVLVEAGRGDGTPETLEHLQLADLTPEVVGVVGQAADAAEIRRLLAAEGADHLVGIRTSDAALAGRSPAERRGFGRALADHGLTWEINVSADGLGSVVELADDLPELSIVLDHVAGFPPRDVAAVEGWYATVAELARRARVRLKISGLLTKPAVLGGRELDQAVRHLVTTFAPARLMLGSDWPVCTQAGSWGRSIARSLAAVAALTPDGQDLLRHGTAALAYPRLQHGTVR